MLKPCIQHKDVDTQSIRSQSQMSMASSSDESQPAGFIGQATKFVSGMFGVGSASTKKDKGQLKSLQLAAAAAKKVRCNPSVRGVPETVPPL